MRGPSEPNGADTLGPPVEFDGPDPPDWLVEWEGSILPRGGGFRGRLSLWRRAGAASAQVEYPASRLQPVFRPTPIPLADEVAALLCVWLEGSFPDRLLSVGSRSIDGIPFELIVRRRAPAGVVRASCNVGDVLGLVSGGGAGASFAAEAVRALQSGIEIAPVLRLGLVLFGDVTVR